MNPSKRATWQRAVGRIEATTPPTPKPTPDPRVMGYLIARPTDWGNGTDLHGPGGLDDYALQTYPTPGACWPEMRNGDRCVVVMEVSE